MVLKCTQTKLLYAQTPVLHLDVPKQEPQLHLDTPGIFWTTGASSAPEHVYTTEACDAPGHVYITGA